MILLNEVITNQCILVSFFLPFTTLLLAVNNKRIICQKMICDRMFSQVNILSHEL